MLKNDSTSKELVPVNNLPCQQTAKQIDMSIKETKPITNITPQIVNIPQQAATRTFRFLGKEMALPSVVPERNFFAASKFSGNIIGSDSKAQNEFELY